MISSTAPALAALSLLAFAAAPIETSVEPAPSVHPVRSTLALGVPAPTQPLVLEAASPTLEDLVHAFEKSVGALVVKNAEVCNMAANERLSIREPVTVPVAEVYPFFENLLVQSGYRLSFLKGGEVPMFALHSLRHSPQANYTWLEVGGADLEALSDHPALMVSYTVSLPKLDARELTSAMRSLVSDSNSTAILPMGANSLFLRGSGSAIASMARSAHQANDEAPDPVVQKGAGEKQDK